MGGTYLGHSSRHIALAKGRKHMDGRKELRRMLEDDKVYVVPGVYDCVSSRIVEDLGFEAAFISGYGLGASVLGNPVDPIRSRTLGFKEFSELAGLSVWIAIERKFVKS